MSEGIEAQVQRIADWMRSTVNERDLDLPVTVILERPSDTEGEPLVLYKAFVTFDRTFKGHAETMAKVAIESSQKTGSKSRDAGGRWVVTPSCYFVRVVGRDKTYLKLGLVVRDGVIYS